MLQLFDYCLWQFGKQHIVIVKMENDDIVYELRLSYLYIIV